MVRRAGFTLIEVMVAVAIVAVVLAIAAPVFLRDKPEQKLKEATSDFVTNVRYARSLAVSGATIAGMSPDRIELRFVDPLNYTIVALQEGTPDIVNVLRYGRLDDGEEPPEDISMAVAMTPPNIITFQRNGSANKVALVTLTEAKTGRNRVVEITRAGLARIQ